MRENVTTGALGAVRAILVHVVRLRGLHLCLRGCTSQGKARHPGDNACVRCVSCLVGGSSVSTCGGCNEEGPPSRVEQARATRTESSVFVADVRRAHEPKLYAGVFGCSGNAESSPVSAVSTCSWTGWGMSSCVFNADTGEPPPTSIGGPFMGLPVEMLGNLRW